MRSGTIMHIGGNSIENYPSNDDDTMIRTEMNDVRWL